MRCPSCGYMLPEGQSVLRFCVRCGFELPRSAGSQEGCYNCGTVLPAGSTFCLACGAKVAPGPPRATAAAASPPLPAGTLRAGGIPLGVPLQSGPWRLGSLIASLLLSVFAATVVAFILTSIVPGTLNWLAPVVCDEGFKGSVVAESIYQDHDGTTVSATMYCIDKEGFAVEVSDFVVRPLFGVALGLGLWILLPLLRLLLRPRRLTVLAVLLALASLVSGCSWGTMPEEEFDRLYGDRLKGTGGVSMFYGTEAALLGDALASALGKDGMIQSATLYFNRANLDAQDPSDRSREKQFSYEDGSLSPWDGSSPISADNAAEFFKASDVPWARIPEIVEAAHKGLGTRDVFVRHANISKDSRYVDFLKGSAGLEGEKLAQRLRLTVGPEATLQDTGIRLMLYFGESSAPSSVEMDTAGHVLRVQRAAVAAASDVGKATPAGVGAAGAPSPALLTGPVPEEAASRLMAALNAPNLEVTAVRIYDSHLSFDVVSPADASTIESYTFRDRGFDAGSAQGNSRAQREKAFLLRDARLDRLQENVRAGLASIQEGFRPTHAFIEKQEQGSVALTLYVQRDGQTEYVTLAADGSWVRPPARFAREGAFQ